MAKRPSSIPAEYKRVVQRMTRYTTKEDKLIRSAAKSRGITPAAFIRETSLSACSVKA